jgi:uncharacterized protein YbjT (DUF2867 family)
MTLRILVIGGTGAVGGAVVSKLLNLSEAVSIRVSSRDPSKVKLPKSVEVVQADLNDPACYHRLFENIDKAFVYTQAQAPYLELCRVAKSSGVKHIVLLSSIAVEQAPHGPIGQSHANAENAIKESGLSYSLLRPGYFATNVKLMGWALEIKEHARATVPVPNSYTEVVSEEDIAAAAVVALTTDKVMNGAVHLTGPESITLLAQFDAISAIRQAAGLSPVKIVNVSGEKWVETCGLPAGMANGLVGIWKQTDGRPGPVNDIQKITGKPGTTFKQWAEQNKHLFM